MQNDIVISAAHPALDPPLVLDLREISSDEFPLAGGKGTNLGFLCRAGFPVPEGFCLTTAAYDAACGHAPISLLVDEVAAELAAEGRPSPGRLEGLAAALRTVIAGAVYPRRVEEALRSAYSGLGDDIAVAVRSSATAEDLPAASFAGQQDTYLNIIGLDAVLDAVRRCWASLWADRAVTYRNAVSLDHRKVKLAVIVQRLVNAHVSGVLFTANPLTGRRREAVIDASFGLGEAIVSGAVNPDHFIVDSARGEVIARHLGKKGLRVRARAEGGTEAVESDSELLPCLDNEQILKLSRLGVRVEDLFSNPQDVEWAIDDSGDVWLTQARPITTLFPLPDGAPGDAADLRVYYSINASQGMESPFTPMGASLFRLLASSTASVLGYPPLDALAGPSFIQWAGGRLYLDVTRALRNRLGRAILMTMTTAAEARAAAALKGLASDSRFSLLESSIWPFIRKGTSFLIRSRILFHLIQSLISPEAARRRTRALSIRLQALANVPPAISAEDRLRRVVRLLSPKSIRRLLQIMPTTVVPAEGLVSLARRLLGPLATAADFEEVLRGVSHNPTTEMDLELWSLAQAIPDGARRLFLEEQPEILARHFGEGSLPAPVQGAVMAFLEQYGHRCAVELDGGLPRWAEQPAPVFAILANFLRSADAGHSPQTIYRSAIERAEERKMELARRAGRRGWLKGAIVRFSLGRARDLLGFREMPRFLISFLLHLARGHLLAVGSMLVDGGTLDSIDDVFFLDLQEVSEALGGKDMRAIVHERREDYKRDSRRRAPVVLLSDGTEVREQGDSLPVEGRTLRGLAASSGVATGIAHVVLDPGSARLEPGEILVAPSTDPGWTPLFLTAAALVMETGGPMAHGAIVAREYGIPAVVAVPDATSRIRSGMRIAVDGTNGRITIL